MGSILMSSLSQSRYTLEIDFFDRSKYSRAVLIKSDHHFVCCDLNCFGLLLASKPDAMDQEYAATAAADHNLSIVRYKSIARNQEYRSFSSEKDCEWNYALPVGEQCVAVGLTHRFAVIATDKRYLRVLSIGGVQPHPILRLPQDVCNIAGHDDNNIVAITFADLSLWVLDLDEVCGDALYDGFVPVSSARAKLTRMFMIGRRSTSSSSNNKRWI
mmetsp:Transcript_54318/g.89948  ORF Transcript_54318/g.89948 Transcript_54318/m.89948 type:complete len:215 (+) Transcript_54318:1-645(+)